MTIAAAIMLGLAAGFVAGLMGVGGGILFVPALTIFLDKGQLQAEATSLLAIIPVAVVGAWRQSQFGNVRLADGLMIGLLSVFGVLLGTVVANALPQRALEISFAVLILFVAFRLARRGLERPPDAPGRPPTAARPLKMD
jgi:uncharacterized protein